MSATLTLLLRAYLVSIVMAASAYAFNVYRLGGEDGNSWQAPLSYEPGQYAIIGSSGEVAGRKSISAVTTHATWRETLVVFVDSVDGQWLRPFLVPDTLNLAQDGIRDRIRRGRYDNLALSGSCLSLTSRLKTARAMFDGDPTTAALFLANASEDPEAGSSIFIQNIIVDLGTNFPVNRIRFFPRLGRENPRIDDLLTEMTPPILVKEDLPEEDFSGNLLTWYEVAAADNRQHFSEVCSDKFGNQWFTRILGIEHSQNDSRFTVLARDTENLRPIVEIRFPVRPLQWIAVRPLLPIHNWEIAEFQIFGTGFVGRAVYRSAVLDLGENMVFGKIRWEGERDADAEVFIRTRSGTDPDPNLYWKTSFVEGEYVEVDRAEYERSPDDERRTTLDEEHWSAWSSPYPWKAGLRKGSIREHLWQDGTAILSPSPARYFQFETVLVSTLTDAARFRQLEIQFSKPAAEQVVGEIWPVDVDGTDRTTFTYTVKPSLTDEDLGFDRLEIFTLIRADTVRSVEVDDEEMIHRFAPEVLEDRIVVAFPKLKGAKRSGTLIEVVFDTRVVLYGTEFRGSVFDSETNGVKQLIEPGDATIDFGGDVLAVRTRSLGQGPLTAVRVTPNPFTPNSDGVNDVGRFRFQVIGVTTSRMLTLVIYDLAGEQVRRFDPISVVHGVFGEGAGGPVWDGADDEGRKVAPGLYVFQVSLDTDVGTEKRIGTVAVAY